MLSYKVEEKVEQDAQIVIGVRDCWRYKHVKRICRAQQTRGAAGFPWLQRTSRKVLMELLGEDELLELLKAEGIMRECATSKRLIQGIISSRDVLQDLGFVGWGTMDIATDKAGIALEGLKQFREILSQMRLSNDVIWDKWCRNIDRFLVIIDVRIMVQKAFLTSTRVCLFSRGMHLLIVKSGVSMAA